MRNAIGGEGDDHRRHDDDDPGTADKIGDLLADDPGRLDRRLVKLAHVGGDDDTAENPGRSLAGAEIVNGGEGDDLLDPVLGGDVHDPAAPFEHGPGHRRVIGIDEAGVIEIDRDDPLFHQLRRGRRRVRRHQFAGAVESADVPIARVGDDPSLVVEHESVIACIVKREDNRAIFGGGDMLGEFHEVAMIERKHHHAEQRPRIIPDRLDEA